MTIRNGSVRLFRIPPGTRWKDAAVDVRFLEFVIVSLQTNDGLTGTGMAYTVGPGGSAVRALIENDCLPLVLGKQVSDFAQIVENLRRHLNRLGPGGINSFAIASIDIALWDLFSKSRNLPLYRVLGAVRHSIPAYGSGIDLHLKPAELQEHLKTYVEAGFSAVKIKVGCERLSEDVNRVAVARQTIGPDRKLLLDANRGWTYSEAGRRLRVLEQYDPFWIEEPLVAEDVLGHAELRRSSAIPLALGESLYSKYHFSDYLRNSAADILQPDVVRVGGITEWLKIAHLCEAWHRPVAPHYLSEISVHLLCSVNNALFIESVTGGSLKELGLAVSDPIQNGVGIPPDIPGHGIQFRLEEIKQYEVKANTND